MLLVHSFPVKFFRKKFQVLLAMIDCQMSKENRSCSNIDFRQVVRYHDSVKKLRLNNSGFLTVRSLPVTNEGEINKVHVATQFAKRLMKRVS